MKRTNDINVMVLSAVAILFFGITSAQKVAPDLELSFDATYKTGSFDGSAQEISVYSSITKNIYVTNSKDLEVDVLRYTAGPPSTLSLARRLFLEPYGINPNSVDVLDGKLIAVSGTNLQNAAEPGKVLFFTDDSVNTLLGEVVVGAVPDMVKFANVGSIDRLLVANEAEPSDNIDPPGSISIIEWSMKPTFTTSQVKVGFDSFESQIDDLKAKGLRVFPGKTLAQDMEPEYITTWGRLAYVTLQEANAIAVLDWTTGTMLSINPLGYKNIFAPCNSMDTNDQDNTFLPRSYPNLYGMYMPDNLKAYKARDKQIYIITANEGDARNEVVRASTLRLDGKAFPIANLASNGEMGRLEVSNIDGLNATRNGYKALYAYGARSFSIWDATTMELVYDSGNEFEYITFDLYGALFNSNNNCNNCGDSRSDNKGPEPEGVTTGEIDGFTYAFVCLERMGGIMVYDVTVPQLAKFVTYFNYRNFSVPADDTEAGDLGPESVTFVPPGDLGHGPMLLTSNEVSGTTSLYNIKVKRSQNLPKNRKTPHDSDETPMLPKHSLKKKSKNS